MWQLLLAAAAAAGSTSFVAKHIFGQGFKKREGDRSGKLENPFDDAKYQSPVVSSERKECGSGCEEENGVFMFSSPESGHKNEFRAGLKNVRKQSGLGAKKKESEKRSGGVEVSKRRVALCLKKRRTTKSAASKCGSCSSKDSSLFNWGLGVGIMYMMSTGKAEVSKLNASMDETAKIVQELKSELDRRRSLRSMQLSNAVDEVDANSEKNSDNCNKQLLIMSKTGIRDKNNRTIGSPQVDDGDYPISVLTEERDVEVVEMNQLEAELESELQKLPWCSSEACCTDDMKPKLSETDASTKRVNEMERPNSEYYQSHGVSPSLLDQKLSRLLIEQQGNQIVDLEYELRSAQSRLSEKETELHALKDCVRRLTEFSLSTVSDDEVGAHESRDCISECDGDNEIGFESRKPVVGMKRPVST